MIKTLKVKKIEHLLFIKTLLVINLHLGYHLQIFKKLVNIQDFDTCDYGYKQSNKNEKYHRATISNVQYSLLNRQSA